MREADLAQEVRSAEAAAERLRLEAGLARRGAALGEEALRQAQAMEREGRGEADAVSRAELALVEAEEEAALAARDELAARLRLLVPQGRASPGVRGGPGDGAAKLRKALFSCSGTGRSDFFM